LCEIKINPYKGYIEKLKEPIELKGRVIKYKPVAKLGAKKGVQKGGEKFYHKGDLNYKIYRAIQKKLEDDENFLTAEEKDKLGFINPSEHFLFAKANTYLWELYPKDFKDFTNSHLAEDPKYYFGILRIKKKSFLSSQSIYIAFRVNLSKKIIIRGVVHHPETIIELIFLAKGVGIEEFLKNLVKDTSYPPTSQEYRNRSKNINELIELIKKHNIAYVEHYYDEFKKLYIRLSASAQPFKNHGPSPSVPPVTMNKKRNQNFLMSDSILKILKPKIHGTEIVVDPKFKKSAPITQEALNFIKKYAAGSRVLEIGCGSGIYAKLLRENGVDIIASDACRINNEGIPDLKYRMANFTNQRAIPNIICKNAVTAVEIHGQNSNLSLFLSFPLPHDYYSKSISYDEAALRNFKGNKFFLIALYQNSLNEINTYKNSIQNESTGSQGFHNYLAEEWNIKDKLLLRSGGPLNRNCYLIYFERK
jgi:SAM-dependent methyltransferase